MTELQIGRITTNPNGSYYGHAPHDPDDTGDGLRPVDWHAVWNENEDDDAFLIPPVLLTGRQHLIYAPKKHKKSLLVEEWAAALATGRAVLNRRASDPVDVLMIDYENDPREDHRPRLDNMGYGPDDLDRLHCYSFPPLGGLDTMQGANRLERLIEQHEPALVTLDSFARIVRGPENDADTVRNYYAYTGLMLKRHHVTSVRLDNSGKDETAGARGSSAKGDDVDVVWRLKLTENGLQLRRDAERSNHLSEYVNLRRLEEPHLHHVVVGESWPAGTADAIALLERLGVPVNAGVRDARNAIKDANESCAQDVLAAAVRYRRSSQTDA